MIIMKMSQIQVKMMKENIGDNNYSYNVENDSDIDDESNMELSRDDLRVTSALRNPRYNSNYNNAINNNSNSIWSQRLRRPIYNSNNLINNNIQPRTSTRYNLRNHTSSNTNIINANVQNKNFNNGNYNLRNRR